MEGASSSPEWWHLLLSWDFSFQEAPWLIGFIVVWLVTCWLSMSSRLLPGLFSTRVRASDLKWALIHLDLGFVLMRDKDSLLFLYMQLSGLISTICWRCYLCSNMCFWPKNHEPIELWVSTCVVSSIPLAYVLAFLPAPCCLHNCSSIEYLKSGMVVYPAGFFCIESFCWLLLLLLLLLSFCLFGFWGFFLTCFGYPDLFKFLHKI